MKHLFTLLALLIVPSAFAVSSVIQADIDSHTYLPGGTINVSGIVYSGTSPATAGTSVTLNITGGNSATTATGSGGRFSKTMTAPTDLGVHTLTVSASGASTILTFTVSNIADVILDIVNETIVVALDEYPYGGISGADSRIDTSDVNSGNFTIPGVGDYYVIVEKDSATGKYKTAYIDDDSNLSFSNSDDPGGMPLHKYLEEGDKIKLGSKQFTIVYIDPAGSEMVLAERIKPVFEGGEVHKLLAIALDSSGSPASGVALDFKEFADNGTQIGSTATLGNTTANGTILSPLTIRSDLGRVHLVVNDMGHLTYIIRTYLFVVDLKTSEGSPVFVILPGEEMTLSMSVLNVTTSQPIKSNFLVNITISAPDGSYMENMTIINGTHNETFPAPMVTGDYVVEFVTSCNGIKKRVRLRFTVKRPTDFNIFMLPLAKNKGETEGFAPDEGGALLVGATQFGTGKILNLSSLTGNGLNVTFMGIYNTDGTNYFEGNQSLLDPSLNAQEQIRNATKAGNVLITNVTYFFAAVASDAPDFVVNDIKNDFGEQGVVIFFRAPNSTGVYKMKVGVTVNGTTEERATSLGVQELFVHAYPVNNENGRFLWAISPGGNVSLAIEAYDPVSGDRILPENIIDAHLIEVYSDAADEVVTTSMANEYFALTPYDGFSLAVLGFMANDTQMGDHFVRFQMSANVSRKNRTTGAPYIKTVEAIGQGWFQEKMYQMYVYPSETSNGMFGSGSDVNLTVEVRDAAGSSGQSGVSVSLDSVRYAETGENVPGVYQSGSTSTATCTTGSATNTTRAGTCTLSFSPPSTATLPSWNGKWKNGGYEVRVAANFTSGESTVTDYGRGWFEVRNFMFFAHSEGGMVAANQPVKFKLDTRSPNGTGIGASVTMEKLIYYGTWGNGRPPTVLNSSLGIIDSTDSSTGSGTITLISNQLAQEGQYSVKFTATANINGTTQNQTADAWFYVKPFTLFIQDASDNWDRRYSMGDNVTLSIKGYESIDWSTYPPNGTAHGLSQCYIKSVEKMGMWGVDFKKKNELINKNNMTNITSGNECNLSFNLSGFSQGDYSLKIITEDLSGSRAEDWYWMRVELVSVTVPQLMDWVQCKTKYTMTNTTRITIDDSCGGSSDTPIENENASSNCKYKAVQIVTQTTPQSWEDYSYTYFVLDRDDSTVYVNNSGTGNEDEFNSVDFNGGAVQIVTEGETFADSHGTNWTLAKVDSVSNVLHLESTNGIVGYNPWSWDTMNLKYTQTHIYTINQSLSKSGKFLKCDDMHDEEWANIDLDGDGNFGWDNSYSIIMADDTNAGIYNLVLMTNRSSTNFTNARNSTENNFTFGTDKPIYLVGTKYSSGSSGDTNRYQLTFTTNNPGWPGMDLGVYKPESNVTVPIMVTQPSNRSKGISGATVKVIAAVKFGLMGERSYPINSSTETTNNAGIALIEVNTSGIPNGDYFLKIQITKDNATITTDTIWDNPRISIRNFVVRGELGLMGSIGGMRKWNVTSRTSDEMVGGFTDNLDCNSFGCDPSPVLWRMFMWPYDMLVYYNSTGSELLIDDIDQDGDPMTNARKIPISTGEKRINITKMNGNIEWTNVTVFGTDLNMPYYTIIPWNGTPVTQVDRYHNFTIIDANAGADVTLKISRMDPWGEWMISDGTFNVSDRVKDNENQNTTFIIENVTDTIINISWNNPMIMFNSTLDIEGREKIARTFNDSTYSYVVYNSLARNTSEDLETFSGKEMADTVRLIYKNNGSFVTNSPTPKEYKVGQAIDELGGKAVIKSRKWDDLIFISNDTLDGSIVYPLPWLADEDLGITAYIGNFTENQTKIKVKEGGMPEPGMEGETFSNTTYYMMLFDNVWDGMAEVSHAMVDDDVIFDDRWVEKDGEWAPYDYDHDEEGYTEWQYNYSERWFEIGRENWPFTITGFNTTTATVFSFRDFIKKGDTNLTFWVTARNFDGSDIAGNVSVYSISGNTFGCMGPEPIPQETIDSFMNSTTVVSLQDGTGYMKIDTAGLSDGDYNVRFKITSAGGAEYIEKHFFIEPSMFEEGDKEGCEGPLGEEPPPPEGGGG